MRKKAVREGLCSKRPKLTWASERKCSLSREPLACIRGRRMGLGPYRGRMRLNCGAINVAPALTLEPLNVTRGVK